MEYFEVRYPTPGGHATKPSIQWLGDRLPGDEERITQALENDFEIDLISKTPYKGDYRVATYTATYRAIDKSSGIEFKIVADWFHDFNGFIITVDDDIQNNKFEMFTQSLKRSGSFEEMTVQQYSAKHPEW